jgi:hypothetical protein
MNHSDNGKLKFFVNEEQFDINIENVKYSEAIYNSYEKYIVVVKSVPPY